MLFTEEDAPHLKAWIVKRLENTSDADADVLADYVLALLRHDGDIETVRRLCEEEIPDFLKEDSAIFVRDLFDAVLYRLYMPGAPPPPRPAPPSLQVVNAPSEPSYNNFDMAGIPTAPNGSKKRAFADRSDADAQMGRMDFDVNGRAFKQARRNNNTAPGGHYDSFGNYRPPQPARGPSIPQGYPAMPQLPPGMPPLDPNDPVAAIMAMQAMGFQFPGMPGFNPNAPAPPLSSPGARSRPGQRKMPRCRDYDTKGFCARGNSCKFEHGQESIYVPPGAGDEYDPTNSSLMLGVEGPPITSRPPPISFNPNPFQSAERGRGRGRGQFSDRGGPGGAPGRRGGRAEFSSDRPNLDRSNTTIVVENIPEEKFSEDAVRGFFSEFGNILGVDMKPYKRLAIVKYDQWEAAQAAYNSPKVIFDNRFVKVYWYKDEASLPQPPSADFAKPPPSAPHFDTAATATPEPRIDMEEFARKQADLQRVHEEKMKKKKEMEEARETMQKRQEDLLKRQAEEKRKLMEKLAAKEGKPVSTEGEGEGKPLSQAEALKKQLAALEAEARSLGIDPQQAEEGSSWSVRGGRGRGRGAFRTRGAYAPRGYPARGGYRGRGAPAFSTGGNAYKLDNRTKKVGISGVDFTDAEKDESLRQYLLGIGEYASIETTPDRTAITFNDRFTAEKFMYGTSNNELPGIGKVELSWIQMPLAPVNLPSAGGAGGSAPMLDMKEHGAEDTHMDGEGEGDAMAQEQDGSAPGRGAAGAHRVEQGQQELDYDVGDDNDWSL